MNRRLFIGMFLALLPALGFAQNLVLIGGNLRDDNANVWNKMISLAGGTGVAKIGVISASSSDTAEGGKVVYNFLKYGALSATSIPVTAITTHLPSVAATVQQMTGIFIVEDSGSAQRVTLFDRANAFLNNKTISTAAPDGVVCYEGVNQNRLKLVNVLRPFGVDSVVLTAIKKVLNNGGMVAGNAAIMGTSAMVLQGDSLGALTQGTRFFYWPRAARIPLTYSIRGGLGFIKNYVLDSRVSELGREGRLIRLTQMTKNLPFVGTSKGLGVGENIAFVVSNPLTQPIGTVITATNAQSGVFLTDVSNLSALSVLQGVYDKVPFSFLTVNDTIDLTSNQVTFDSRKTALTGQEYFETAKASADVLSNNATSQWRISGRELIDAKVTTLVCCSLPSYTASYNIPVVTPRARVTFDRTQAVGYGSDSPDGTVYIPSYTNMLATIKLIGVFSSESCF